jgi:hypothetical protein
LPAARATTSAAAGTTTTSAAGRCHGGFLAGDAFKDDACGAERQRARGKHPQARCYGRGELKETFHRKPWRVVLVRPCRKESVRSCSICKQMPSGMATRKRGFMKFFFINYRKVLHKLSGNLLCGKCRRVEGPV